MNSFSGNSDLRSERLPLWGDNVRLSSIPPIEPVSASDAAAEPEAPITHAASDADDEQWDERPSYRRRRDAEDDGRRWRDATGDRGSVWERGATIIEAPERPRRERVSAYLDESSVVRVTRRSSLRTEQQTDTSDAASRGTTRRSTHGFSLVSDSAQRDDQREDERSGVNWDYQTDDSFDGDIHAAEAVATARWGSASSDGASEARGEDATEPTAPTRRGTFATLHTNTADARGTAYQWRTAEDTDKDATEPTSTTWSDAFAALHEDTNDARDTSYQQWASEDTDEPEDPTLMREQPLPADDAAENLGSDASARRRRADDAEERGGLWGIVDAICYVPEAVGSFVLGAVGRIRMPGLVVTATLYNPVRDLYLAHRRLDTLQKTYDAVAAQNEQLEREIEVLQTREGIENEARSRGYVEPGETKVIVKGLTTEGGNSTYTITDTELPDDRPWYIKALDYLLGYDPEA